MSKNWNNDQVNSPLNNNATTDNSNSQEYPPIISHARLPFSPSATGRSKFPAKLRQLLEESEAEGNQHIVSWLPHGKAFRVHKPQEFARKIVGRYFNHGQYRSFTRQLYHYEFVCIDSGADTGAFYHPRFIRDRPDLALFIERKKDTKKKADEQSTGESRNTKTDQTSELSKIPKSPGKDFFQTANAIQTQFQPLAPNKILNEDEGRSDRIERGITGLLNQLSNEDQMAMIRNFSRSNDGELSGKGGCNSSQSSDFTEGLDMGLLFGDDDPIDSESMKLPIHHLESQTAMGPQAPRSPDWLSTITNFFEKNSSQDDVFDNEDLEPRPIEEMIRESLRRQFPFKRR